MAAATFHHLIPCVSTEHDSSFLASLYKCFTDSLRVVGGPSVLSQGYQRGIIEATKRQLQLLADRRKGRATRAASEAGENGKEELALLEEIEDFAPEDTYGEDATGV